MKKVKNILTSQLNVLDMLNNKNLIISARNQSNIWKKNIRIKDMQIKIMNKE